MAHRRRRTERQRRWWPPSTVARASRPAQGSDGLDKTVPRSAAVSAGSAYATNFPVDFEKQAAPRQTVPRGQHPLVDKQQSCPVRQFEVA
jgi:hypothetical protein